MGFSDKFNNWKNNRQTKFRSQNNSSKNETRADSKDIVNALTDERKLKVFAYDFKKSYHKNWIIHLKELNFYSFIIFGVLILSNIIFYGLFKNINLIDPTKTDPSQFDSNNHNTWLIMFLTTGIMCLIFGIYILVTFIVKLKRNKKYSNQDTYKYYYSENLVLNIIMIVSFFFAFISFKPFGFAPVTLLRCLSYNPPEGKCLIIFSFTVQVFQLIAYLVFTATTIACYCCNPKFNIDKIKA